MVHNTPTNSSWIKFHALPLLGTQIYKKRFTKNFFNVGLEGIRKIYQHSYRIISDRWLRSHKMLHGLVVKEETRWRGGIDESWISFLQYQFFVLLRWLPIQIDHSFFSEYMLCNFRMVIYIDQGKMLYICSFTLKDLKVEFKDDWFVIQLFTTI